MKHAFTAARIILGLMFFVFGLNFFLQFIPMPPPKEEMKAMMEAFFTIGYLMPVVKTIEVLSGLLLISGFFVPLALLFLAPIVVNIAIIHFVYDLSGAPMAAIIILLMLTNAWAQKDKFASILKIK
jgi:uncharacterized membrane protein YphA (DoxX/SURF4 family)